MLFVFSLGLDGRGREGGEIFCLLFVSNVFPLLKPLHFVIGEGSIYIYRLLGLGDVQIFRKFGEGLTNLWFRV